MTTFPPAADAEQLARWPVVDEDGERIGTIEALFADTGRGTLEWAGVDVGLLGRRHLVPLADAFVGDGFLQVGYSKQRVAEAPVPDDADAVDGPTEHALYAHYGLPWEDEPAGDGHEPPDGAEGAARVLVRRPSLLERFAYS